jgi:hypothetical protein
LTFDQIVLIFHRPKRSDPRPRFFLLSGRLAAGPGDDADHGYAQTADNHPGKATRMSRVLDKVRDFAKIVSPVWSEARGSIAGTTYLTTPNGQIIARQRTRPTQPVSFYRTAIRNAMTEAVNVWTTLSASQQAAWQAWALAHGSGTHPESGRQMMIGGRSFILYASNGGALVAPIDDFYYYQPEFTDSPAFTVEVAARHDPGVGFSLTVKNVGTMAMFAIVEFSQPFGVSRNYWKGPWIPTLNDGMQIANGVANSKDYSMGLAGDYIFIRVRAVSMDTTAHKHGHVVTSSHIVRTIVYTTT